MTLDEALTVLGDILQNEPGTAISIEAEPCPAGDDELWISCSLFRLPRDGKKSNGVAEADSVARKSPPGTVAKCLTKLIVALAEEQRTEP